MSLLRATLQKTGGLFRRDERNTKNSLKSYHIEKRLYSKVIVVTQITVVNTEIMMQKIKILVLAYDCNKEN